MYYNDHLAKNAKLHMQVLVANIGTRFSKKNSNIVKQIQLLANDHTSNFLGVVGLPFSTSVNAYMQYFNDAHIPVISPTASRSEFNFDLRHWSYFHRMVSDTTKEGQYAAQFAQQLLKQQNSLPNENILVFQAIGDSEQYSTALGEGFTNAKTFTPAEQPTAHLLNYSTTSFFETGEPSPPSLPDSCVDAPPELLNHKH